MEIGGERDRYGFELVRFVVAADAQTAAENTLTLVRESPQWRGALNGQKDSPICSVNEVQVLGPTENVPAKQPGFAFYPVDDET